MESIAGSSIYEAEASYTKKDSLTLGMSRGPSGRGEWPVYAFVFLTLKLETLIIVCFQMQITSGLTKINH